MSQEDRQAAQIRAKLTKKRPSTKVRTAPEQIQICRWLHCLPWICRSTSRGCYRHSPVCSPHCSAVLIRMEIIG